jgi:hypothetical protein
MKILAASPSYGNLLVRTDLGTMELDGKWSGLNAGIVCVLYTTGSLRLDLQNIRKEVQINWGEQDWLDTLSFPNSITAQQYPVLLALARRQWAGASLANIPTPEEAVKELARGIEGSFYPLEVPDASTY